MADAEIATIRKFRIVQIKGSRQVQRETLIAYQACYALHM